MPTSIGCNEMKAVCASTSVLHHLTCAHLEEELLGQQPLSATLQGVDKRAARDDIRLDAVGLRAGCIQNGISWGNVAARDAISELQAARDVACTRSPACAQRPAARHATACP